MCVIVDVSAAHEVFGPNPTEAGQRLWEWVAAGTGRMVAGGRLRHELDKTRFRDSARELQLAGRLTACNQQAVEEATQQLHGDDLCTSNDPHVIALAQVSGARLLFTDDRTLQRDFTNKSLIDQPRGKIYPARGDGSYRDGSFERTHKRLLRQKNLCQTPTTPR